MGRLTDEKEGRIEKPSTGDGGGIFWILPLNFINIIHTSYMKQGSLSCN